MFLNLPERSDICTYFITTKEQGLRYFPSVVIKYPNTHEKK